jgi:hypothetical protein
MKKSVSSTLFVLLSLAGLSAQAGEAYGGVGTTGLELGYGFKPHPSVGLRAEANFMDLGRDFNSNGADYNAKLKFQNLGAYVDYFLGDSFRLTGGLLLGKRKLEGKGVTTGGTVKINGTSYPAPAGESVTVTDTFPDATPYLGLGFGHGQKSAGWGFYFDAGVAIGKGDTSVAVTPGLVTAAGQSNIDAEQAKVQDKLDKLKAFPVVKLGVTYGF